MGWLAGHFEEMAVCRHEWMDFSHKHLIIPCDFKKDKWACSIAWIVRPASDSLHGFWKQPVDRGSNPRRLMSGASEPRGSKNARSILATSQAHFSQFFKKKPGKNTSRTTFAESKVVRIAERFQE
jgi:hypothetical protein